MKNEVLEFGINNTISYYKISKNKKNIILYFVNGKKTVIDNTESNLENIIIMMEEQADKFVSDVANGKYINRKVNIKKILLYFAWNISLGTILAILQPIYLLSIILTLASMGITFKVLNMKKEYKAIHNNIKNKRISKQAKLYEYYFNNYKDYSMDKENEIDINNIDLYTFKQLEDVHNRIERDYFIQNYITKPKVRTKKKT